MYAKLQKNPELNLWPIMKQERIESKEVKSILETAGYTKQWIIHSTHTQLHTSPTPSPHHPCILFTSHPALIPFLSLHIAGLHPTSFSVRVALFNPCSWKYSISSVLQIPFTSHHLPIFQPSPPLYLIFPHFKSPSHYLSPFCPLSWKQSIFSSLQIHFTSHSTFLTLYLKVLNLEGKSLKNS